MRIDRSSDRPVRYLEWRVRLLGAGAILGVVGIGAGAEWLVTAAIAVLVAAAVLGVVARRAGEGEEDEEGHEEDHEDGVAEVDRAGEAGEAGEDGAHRDEHAGAEAAADDGEGRPRG